MSNLKKYLIHFFIVIISILLMTLITTIFYYLNIIPAKTYNLIKLITFLLTLFINSFILGKKAKNKGYIEGIKLASFIIIIFMIISLLLKSFSLKYILYYLIILTTSVFGGIVGISTKKEL